MQVDEEVKQPDWREESDSEDEREKKEEQEAKADVKVTFTGGDLTQAGTLVICQGHTAQTMAKIMFSESWTEIGSGERSIDKDGKSKTETTCKIYHLAAPGSFYFLMTEAGKMKEANKTTDCLFDQLKGVNAVVVLDEVYKTQYPN